MDVRVNKTNEKILSAFKRLLKTKSYSELVIENIINEAHIARSTFYKHFKTKDELLLNVLDSIFNHVFSHALEGEKSHDFSKSSILDYKHYITHIFYHLDDERDVIHALFNSTSRHFLIDNLIIQFTPFAKICISNNFFANDKIPQDLLLKSILHNFVLVIDYWDDIDFSIPPEKLTEYFITLNTY